MRGILRATSLSCFCNVLTYPLTNHFFWAKDIIWTSSFRKSLIPGGTPWFKVFVRPSVFLAVLAGHSPSISFFNSSTVVLNGNDCHCFLFLPRFPTCWYCRRLSDYCYIPVEWSLRLHSLLFVSVSKIYCITFQHCQPLSKDLREAKN